MLELIEIKKKEAYIKIRGITYKQELLPNGDITLRRFHDKSNMWVELRFSNEDDKEVIKELKKVSKDILTKYY